VRQRKGIRVLAPSAGRYVASSFLAFAPDSVADVENISVLTVADPSEQVPSVVQARAFWFDESVKLAEITFPVSADEEGPAYFLVEWGSDVRRINWQDRSAEKSLPTLYFEEAEVPISGFDLTAGTLLVRVERHPDLWYYAFLVPVVALIVLLLWRKVKLSRSCVR